MAEININPFFDEMKAKWDRLHCKKHNPSEFCPVGMYCTCDKETKVPDWGLSSIDEEELLFEMSRDPVLESRRARQGLPKHVKCGCKECAQWRAKNWSLIESLDWELKPYPAKEVTVSIAPMAAGVSVPKPQHNAVLTEVGLGVTKALLTALEAGSYSYRAAVDPGPSREDIEDPVYLEAMATAPRTDWASVKLRMKQIKDRIKAERKVRKPRRTSTPGPGKKTTR